MDKRLLAVMVAVAAFAMIAAFTGDSIAYPTRVDNLQVGIATVPVNGDKAVLSGSDDMGVKEGIIIVSNGEAKDEESEGDRSGEEDSEEESEDEEGEEEDESGEEGGSG
ncbi:MAG: hypothetical protein JSU92_12620 [Deltaproteobacteria bacterium]|nr:MAG: hypothetical protein JSU92_12620 [Deltaproteobacteria bacterium]